MLLKRLNVKCPFRVLVVCAAVWLMVLPASAATILYDDFTGAAGSLPDTGKWSSSASGVALDGAGHVVFSPPPTGSISSLEDFAYLPPMGEAVMGRFTCQMWDTPLSPNMLLGLTSGGFGGETFSIMLRTDLGSNWVIYIGSNFNGALYSLPINRSNHTGKWQIDWRLDKVVVYYNDVLMFDSSVNLPTSALDMTRWNIPHIAMKPSFKAYAGSSETDAIDWIHWEEVSIGEIPDPNYDSEPNLVRLTTKGKEVIDFAEPLTSEFFTFFQQNTNPTIISGVVADFWISRDDESVRVSNDFFTSSVYPADQFDEEIVDFNSIQDVLPDNLLRLNVGKKIDWFDEVIWSSIFSKALVLSDLVARGGFRGFCIDLEQYDSSNASFDYSQQTYAGTKSFAEYQDQVRRRGRQLMVLLSADKPDLTILFTWAHATAMRDTGGCAKANALENYWQGLMPAFVDGMMQRGDDVEFIDGFEYAYSFKNQEQFTDVARCIREEGKKISSVPDIYADKMKVGFGLWPTGRGPRYGEPYTFTAEELRDSLHYALMESDELVWLYLDKNEILSTLSWWEFLPQTYFDAINDSVNPSKLLRDNFDGAADSSPDANMWTSTPDIRLDGAGHAYFTVPPIQKLTSLQNVRFRPTTGNPVGRFTVQLMETPLSPDILLELSSSTGEDFIQVRTDMESNWVVRIGNDIYNGYSTLAVANADHSGQWRIDWMIDKVQVYYNKVLVFDTATSLPDGGTDTTQWHIPQVAMRPALSMDGSSGTDAVDWAQWETALIGDFDGDGDVDMVDLAFFVDHWLYSNCQTEEDNWCDGTDLNQTIPVNLQDFAIFAEHWLE